ncbi:hypothetical protein GGR56DRAFT_621031 [Xylariaceae sp. FL0804]|nr:hypothetical protein GGR56DRAFT_621031 [Xylariaceae sp. FL0804]
MAVIGPRYWGVLPTAQSPVIHIEPGQCRILGLNMERTDGNDRQPFPRPFLPDQSVGLQSEPVCPIRRAGFPYARFELRIRSRPLDSDRGPESDRHTGCGRRPGRRQKMTCPPRVCWRTLNRNVPRVLPPWASGSPIAPVREIQARKYSVRWELCWGYPKTRGGSRGGLRVGSREPLVSRLSIQGSSFNTRYLDPETQTAQAVRLSGSAITGFCCSAWQARKSGQPSLLRNTAGSNSRSCWCLGLSISRLRR